MSKRSHTGIYVSERRREGLADDRGTNCAGPLDVDPARKVCRTCGRKIMFIRKVYGPKPRAAHWQHVGDGLTQYHDWGIGRR